VTDYIYSAANSSHCPLAMACDPSLLSPEASLEEQRERRKVVSEHLVACVKSMAGHKLDIGYHDSKWADLLAGLEVFVDYCYLQNMAGIVPLAALLSVKDRKCC
jgi:hypothetical protein